MRRERQAREGMQRRQIKINEESETKTKTKKRDSYTCIREMAYSNEAYTFYSDFRNGNSVY